MISYITADEQRTIRSEIEHARHLLEKVFLRLSLLERTDDRVTRTEQALSALERTLWTMTSGPGRLGPPAKVHAILRLPGPSTSHAAPDRRNGNPSSFALRKAANADSRAVKVVQSANT